MSDATVPASAPSSDDHRGGVPPGPPRIEMGRLWTVPNLLTASRIVLVAPITVLVYQGGPLSWMVGLVLLAIATDWLDGRLARWTGTVSEWGKVLDPIADKVAAACVTVALLTRPPDNGPTLVWWFVLVVIARDLILAVGGILQTRRLGYFISSLWSGRVTVTALALTVMAALLKADPDIMRLCQGLTTCLAVWSVVQYTRRFQFVMRYGREPGRRPPVRQG